MANVTIDGTTIGGSTPDAPTSLTATAGFDGVFLKWSNPTNATISHIQIATGNVNNRANSWVTTLANVNANAFYDHTTGSETKYYWVRAVSTLGTAGNWNAGATSGTSATPQEVTVSSPVSGQVLAYDGSIWSNTSNIAITENTGKIGYSTGSGATVVQSTSKTTSVTIDAPTGTITMANSTLAAGFGNTFTVVNSRVSSTDSIIVNIVSGATYNSYGIWAGNIQDGSFSITLRNLTAATSYSESPVVRFSIIRGASS